MSIDPVNMGGTFSQTASQGVEVKVPKQKSPEERAISGVSVEIFSSEERSKEIWGQTHKYYFEPRVKADKSMGGLDREISSFIEELTKKAPWLDQQWDFTLEDGAIRVIGEDLSTEQKAWLENQLSEDRVIVDLVTRLKEAAVTYFQDEPGRLTNPCISSTGFNEVIKYKDVEKQLNGVIRFRELLDGVAFGNRGGMPERSLTSEKGRPRVPAMDFFAQYLTPYSISSRV
ncbi:hypothetical protein [Chitiniphilus eburneus]|uniref:hypothetical protein n=1 Tax=Chitiniphilus eburneus TaxID=2571148 RepID=UPI0035CFBB41